MMTEENRVHAKKAAWRVVHTLSRGSRNLKYLFDAEGGLLDVHEVELSYLPSSPYGARTFAAVGGRGSSVKDVQRWFEAYYALNDTGMGAQQASVKAFDLADHWAFEDGIGRDRSSARDYLTLSQIVIDELIAEGKVTGKGA